jgi:hypothetical protein
MGFRGRRTGDRKRWSILRPQFVCATYKPEAPAMEARLRWRFRLVCCAFAFLALLGGCRSGQKSALTEAELRTREREVRDLQTDLRRAENMNQAMARELTDRRQCTTPPYPPSSSVEGPASIMGSMVKEVLLGRGTGGIDDDGWPGDEALQVVLVPQDVDGHAVKVPGSLVVIVFEVTSDGLKVPLDRWDIAPLQLQRNWRNGLFSTGYYISLPWRKWPASEKLRVVAQFTTLPDGRVLEADRDVKIRLMPGGPRGVPVSGPPGTIVMPPAPRGDAPFAPEFPAPCFPDENPLTPPGAWFRDTQPPPGRREAAKPAPGPHPARLLGPELKRDISSPSDP